MKKDKDLFSWDNITIDMYYDIVDILNDEEADDITKNVRLIALILDKDESEVWDMDMTKVGDYVSRLKFLSKFDIPSHPKMKINIPGYNLEVMKDVTKISVAQYVDYQSFVGRPFRESMAEILSIFLIPEGKKYNEGYDIIDLQKVIRNNLSFRVAEGLLGFFLRRYSELLIRSLRYYRKAIQKEMNQERKTEMEKTIQQIREKIEVLIHLAGSGPSKE